MFKLLFIQGRGAATVVQRFSQLPWDRVVVGSIPVPFSSESSIFIHSCNHPLSDGEKNSSAFYVGMIFFILAPSRSWNSQLFAFFSSLPAFFWLIFRPLVSIQTSFLIEAGQPSGFNSWSLLTTAYPDRQRSKHDEGWACGSHYEWWIYACVYPRARLRKGFLPLTGEETGWDFCNFALSSYLASSTRFSGQLTPLKHRHQLLTPWIGSWLTI